MLLGAGLCHVVAFLAYEAAVVLPLLALLQDLARGRNPRNRPAALMYGALGLLAGIQLVARGMTPHGMNLNNPGFSPMSDRQLVFSSAYFLVDHLLWWAIPFGRQEVLGTFVWGKTVPGVQLLMAWLAVLLSLAVLISIRRRWPMAALGGAWSIAAFLPMTNLIPLRTGPFGDYYLAVPSIGLVLVVIELLRKIWAVVRQAEDQARRWKAVGWAAVAGIGVWRGAAALTAFPWAERWNDPVALYRQSERARPFAYRARANLARDRMLNGHLTSAAELARWSHEDAPWYTLPYNIMGDVANRQGKHEEARDWCRNAISNGVADAYTHCLLAFTCETWLNDMPAAKEHYEAVIARKERHTFREVAFLNLGRLMGIEGNPQGATRLLRRALSEFPRSADIHHNLAVAYAEAGEQAKGDAHRREASRLRGKAGSARPPPAWP